MTKAGRRLSPRALARGVVERAERAMGPQATSTVWGAPAAVTPGRPGRWLATRSGVAGLQAALADGRLDDALSIADTLVERSPESVRAQELRADVLQRLGGLTEPARVLHDLNRRFPTPRRVALERNLLGRIAETEPGWLPRIPPPAGPAASLEPVTGTVLHLLKESAPYLTNGFTMRSRYNLLAAREAGLRPVVVTSIGFPRTIGIEAFDAIELVDGIPHHRLDVGPFYPRHRAPDQLLVDQAWMTARIARVVRPEILHVSSGFRGYETALVGLAVRNHIRRPMVYEVRSFFESTWSQDERWNDRGELYDRRFATEARAMAAADHVITIADAMREDIVGRGVPAERVTILPNGVDCEAFRPIEPDPALRAQYGIAPDTFVFGYVSNLDHRRENQELLVEATAVLERRGRRVACLIVGDGARRAEVEAGARRAGVARSVVFTGRVAHDVVRQHYAVMDAFVVPRRDERASRAVTPLKPYEALAMERPLVVADLPALLEIIGTDRGLAFRAGDAGHLADVLERLIDDPALGHRLGATGRRWVAAERSWSTNGTRLRDLYREVEARWRASAVAT